VLVPGAGPDLAYDDEPGVNAHANREAGVAVPSETNIQPLQRVDNPERRPHCPLGIVLVGPRIAKVDKESVAEILGDVALEPLDYLGAGLLVGSHQVSELLRVQTSGEGGRPHQVAEHDGELATLGLGHMAYGAVCRGSRRPGECRLPLRLAAATTKLVVGIIEEAALGTTDR
jgi:hypothetical protein